MKSILIFDDYNQNIIKGGIIGTLTCQFGNSAKRHGCKIIEIMNNKIDLEIMEENQTNVREYRIRKLTERECFRLMGVDDKYIDKIKSAGISKSQQYKMAGNSIVVDVLEAIFNKMFIDKDVKELTLF